MRRLARPALVVVALGVLLAGEVLAVGLDLIFPPPMSRAQTVSPLVLDRRGAWLRALPVEQGRWRVRADLRAIDPVFLRRLKAMEDRRFDLHAGVDPLALLRAMAGDLKAGRVRSGGSTITMQLARRLQPRRRTLGAKLVEAARAVQLEYRLGKSGVLADYLTLTPYGGNLEGVRAAALAYFGHAPDHLDDAEQALLIALPQAPEARRPDRHPLAARAARDHVLDRLRRTGLISSAGALLAKSEPAPPRRPLPAMAWQATGELARRATTRQPEVITTLDARLQSKVAALADQTAAGQGPETSTAVLVIDIRTRAVRAAIGSAGLDRPGGWIDATRAIRSPGSALKPFIYAMAFEAGLAAPETKIKDAPTGYGGYAPRNFDRSFQGEVTVRQALQSSLNTPAVQMLAKVGPGAFEQRLRAAGVSFVRPKAALTAPSLALALGGEGVTLRDVAMLYAALGDGGVAKPLAWTVAEERARARPAGVRLVRQDAADQVLAILRQGAAPPDRLLSQAAEDAAPVAFKTGTSYGYRDAWAAGVRDGYAVVVWTGRPDGGGRPGCTGRRCALPLLFDVFDQLKSTSPGAPAGMLDGAPPAGLQSLKGETDPPPRLMFPPDGAKLHLAAADQASGVALSARGRDLSWFVDGEVLRSNAATGQTLWRPKGPGFFLLEAVDAAGRRAQAHVRVTP